MSYEMAKIYNSCLIKIMLTNLLVFYVSISKKNHQF